MNNQQPTSLDGGCHCGNIRLRFESAHKIADLPLRTCMCSFCRAHGVRTTSDPQGSLRLRVADPALLNRYRFGLKTADFLICRSCGVYVGAVLQSGQRQFATLNINVLDLRGAFRQSATSEDYDGEQAADRAARRLATWTPAIL
jgi:hypothetical protein